MLYAIIAIDVVISKSNVTNESSMNIMRSRHDASSLKSKTTIAIAITIAIINSSDFNHQINNKTQMLTSQTSIITITIIIIIIIAITIFSFITQFSMILSIAARL